MLVQPGPIRTEWNAIARDNLVRRSASTAYATQAASVARPRTRYPSGRGAATLMVAVRLLPDRVVDAFVARSYLG